MSFDRNLMAQPLKKDYLFTESSSKILNQEDIQSINCKVVKKNFPLIYDNKISHLEKYSFKDGFPSDLIFCTDIDKKGNLWIGSIEGISIFDGVNIKNFSSNYGINNASVSCLKFDNNNVAWFGQVGYGLSIFDGFNFKNIFENTKFSKSAIFTILHHNDSTILSTNDGLLILHSGKIEELKFQNQLLSNEITCSLIDRNNRKWFGTKNGLFYIENGKCNVIDFKIDKKNLKINCISQDREGKIWIGTQYHGLYYYIENQLTKIEFQNFDIKYINDIYCDKSGIIWIVNSKSCILNFDGNSFKRLNLDLMYNQIFINNIKEDKFGNMWFGSYNGLYKLGSRNIKYINIAQIKDFDFVKSICITKNKETYCISEKSLIQFIDINKNQDYKIIKSDINPESIFCDKEGKIWVGTKYKGLYCFKNNKLIQIKNSQILNNRTIWYFKEDKKGNIWIGTLDDGIYLYDGKSISKPAVLESLVPIGVNCFDEDSKGNLYIGTFLGELYKYDGTILSKVDFVQNLKKSFITCIKVDKFDNVWFGSWDKGLYRYDGKSVLNINTAVGLTNNSISGLLIDNYNNLLIGTNNGLSKIGILRNSFGNEIGVISNLSNEEFNNYLPIFKNYNIKNGYPIIDINGNQNSMIIDDKNTLWLTACANNMAIIQFNYINEIENENDIELKIDNFRLGGENICWNYFLKNKIGYNTEKLLKFEELLSDSIISQRMKHFDGVTLDSVSPYSFNPINPTIPYKNNSFSFTIAVNNPSINCSYLIKYKLLGYDKEWKYIENAKQINYSNLPVGTYLLAYMAQKNNGEWSKPEYFRLKIETPYYRTWWAVLLYCFGLFLIILWVEKIRLKSILKEKLELENVINERSKIIDSQVVEFEKQRNEALRQKFINEEINSELNKLTYVAQHTSNGVLITNPNGEVEWFNEGFSNLYGWDNIHDFKQNYAENIIESSYNINLKKDLEAAILEKKPLTYEAVNINRYGDKMNLQITVTPVFEKDKCVNLIFISSNITELVNAKIVAERALKIQEQFLANTSHEIRTPLNGVIGMIRQLQNTELTEKQAEYFKILDNSSKNLLFVVNDLLDISKLRSDNIEFENRVFNLDHILKNLVESLKYKAKRSIYI
ncbi:MAG: PAS domain-containing protein [Saprospiraceae bacterium]|nr:PAS domain-containing protein [Saprospiraceae bacterium]